MKTTIHMLTTGLFVMLCMGLVLNMIGCDGPQGIQGPAGDTVIGAPGPAGQPGHDGVDFTGLSVVPLCPGVSSYGTFVEVALDINGQLFAVYSQNGGFLTYLPPGDYTSTGVGSACNFTVNADGVSISH